MKRSEWLIHAGRKAEELIIRRWREIVDRGHGELKIDAAESSGKVEITQVIHERVEDKW